MTLLSLIVSICGMCDSIWVDMKRLRDAVESVQLSEENKTNIYQFLVRIVEPAVDRGKKEVRHRELTNELSTILQKSKLAAPGVDILTRRFV